MSFSLMILAGKSWDQPLEGRNSRKNTVARDAHWKGIWHCGKSNLVTENARSGVKEFATGMFEISSLLPLFSYQESFPPLLLDRKSNNLLHQSPNLPLHYARGRTVKNSSTTDFTSVFSNQTFFPLHL